jgi:hypothetical protein
MKRRIRWHLAAHDRAEHEPGNGDETPGQQPKGQVIGVRPQQDSNLRTRLRRPLLYPLSYGGWRTDPATAGFRRGLSKGTSNYLGDTRSFCQRAGGADR